MGSKAIVKWECLLLAFFSRLDGYNQTLLLGGGGGECSVIACYSRFVCLTSWRHVTYFNKGGGGPEGFFGSEILTKMDFSGSMMDTGIF